MFRSLLAGLAVACLSTSVAQADIPLQPQSEPPAISPEAKTFTGQIRPLLKILRDRKIACDKDITESVLTLEGEDEKLFTLVKDQGSRMFFVDQELHARPLQLMAVQIPGTQMLKVERVRTVVDGKLMEVDYWCEKCALRYSEPGICICCGEQNARRELPLQEIVNSGNPAVQAVPKGL